MGMSKNIRRLGIRRKPSGWYITNVPLYYADGEPHREYGPYETKGEAIEDRDGLQRTFEEIGFEDEDPNVREKNKKKETKPKVKAFSGGLLD